MQFLPSFHTVFTCSFVLLLAYVLSRFFTYLAHSAIHGSTRARTRADASSSRGRRDQSYSPALTEQNEFVTTALYRLQEEDEDEVETRDLNQDYGELETAPHSLSTNFEMARGIFDDTLIDPPYNLTRLEADKGDGSEYAPDNYGTFIDEEGSERPKLQLQDKVSEDGDVKRRVAAMDNGLSSAADGESKAVEEEEGNKSVLGDAEGSSSLQRRLPPTWSDLEKMVSSSSMKSLAPPSVYPPTPED